MEYNKINEEVLMVLKNKELKIKKLIKIRKQIKATEELELNYFICKHSESLSESEKLEFYLENFIEFDDIDYQELIIDIYNLKGDRLNLERDLQLLLIDYDENFLKLFYNMTTNYIKCCEKLYEETTKDEANVRLVKTLINNINVNLSYCKRLLDGELVEEILQEINNK